jgi:hypothetical protein
MVWCRRTQRPLKRRSAPGQRRPRLLAAASWFTATRPWASTWWCSAPLFLSPSPLLPLLFLSLLL